MYRLTRKNGSFYAQIPSNVILGPNTPTTPAPLNLIGRNKVSYGEAQNENFLWLAENFANTSAPEAPVKGQLWYDYTNDVGTGGELKIAPVDNVLSDNWLTVPVIAEVNSEPPQSNAGRIIIHKKTALKVRMNDSWHTIVTEVPQDKLIQLLLPIRNDTSPVDGIMTTVTLDASVSKRIAKFNDGAYVENSILKGIDSGVLKYGAVYQWEADIVARSASDVTVYKVWTVKGAFDILREADQTGKADPRRITSFNKSELNYSVIKESAGTELWDVWAVASADTPGPTLSVNAIADGDFYGLDFVATSGASGSSIQTQWSVYLRMTGIPSTTITI